MLAFRQLGLHRQPRATKLINHFSLMGAAAPNGAKVCDAFMLQASERLRPRPGNGRN